MQKRRKLTWQGRDDGVGRWKKVYRGQVHYFSGGHGKSDIEAYRRAVTEWEQLKVTLDQEADQIKPHRAEYEVAINQWQAVFAWGRENDDVASLAAASAKIAELRKRLEAPQPIPISRRRDLPISQIGMTSGAATVPPAEGDRVTTGEALGLANALQVPDDLELARVQDIVDQFVVGRTWRTRIEREQRKSAKGDTEFSLGTVVAKFIEKRRISGVTAGAVANLQRHLNFLIDEMGVDLDARTISGKTIDRLHQLVMSAIENQRFSRASARDLQASIRSFVQWLWEIEVLPELPRNLSVKSHRIVVEPNVVRVFSIKELQKIYTSANDYVRLFMLLALNCGMTQIDISDLHPSDVDWKKKTLSRKRGKTKQFESVPTVTYALWPQTLTFLKEFKSSNEKRLLLAPEGGPLKVEVSRNGKMAKNDYVGLSFHRLVKAQNLKGQFKMLKKTSASLLRNHPTFSGLEGVFLDHAPRTMSDKHYAQVPTELLGAAIHWLHGQFNLPTHAAETSE